MAKRYFELMDDMSSPERWVLGDALDSRGQTIGASLFLNEAPVHFDGRLRIPISHPGSPLDFSFSDSGDFPVVTSKIAQVLAEGAPADVQLYPAQVDSQSEPYFLVNVARQVRCIDDDACTEVSYWEPEDGRPDKVGQYRSVYGMRIAPSRVGDARVFRPWGYAGTLLVSEEVKDALERTGASGLEFTEVTGPSALSDEERAYKRKCSELLEPPPKARRTAWKSLGELDELTVTSRAINPTWPGRREDWALIHRESGRTLLVSEGLSDPFIARLEPSVGFGLELVLETDRTELPPGAIEASWPFRLLARVAREVVAHDSVRERAKGGPCLLEVSGAGLPGALVTPEGRVGVLLGLVSPRLPRHFPTPFGDVRLVTVQALVPASLGWP